MTTTLMGRHAMIAVPSPVNLCALTIIPPASLYMTLAHEYASREPNPEPKPQTQTPNPKPKPQTRTRTRTRTRTQTRSPNRSPNRSHRISSALGMGAEGSSAGGKGGMNPSKGEGSIPRCSLYPFSNLTVSHAHILETLRAVFSPSIRRASHRVSLLGC